MVGASIPDTCGSTELVHATCLVVDGAGVLLVGPSGAGKSDLALRLLHAQIRVDGRVVETALVADDQVLVAAHAGRLIARPPLQLAGLMEVRGIGILPVSYRPEVQLTLVIKLVRPGHVERFPEPAPGYPILGLTLPCATLSPFETSAPLKVALLVRRQET